MIVPLKDRLLNCRYTAMLIVIPIVLTSFTQKPSPSLLERVHPQLLEAVNNSRIADSLLKAFGNVKNGGALNTALLGYVQSLKAKHVWNPISKISYVRHGCSNLNKAVSVEPGSIEVRYLRYAIEVNIPSVLGYSGHLDQDKAVLLSFIENHFSEEHLLVKYICLLLLHTSHTTPSEMKLCRQKLVG